MQLLKDVYVKPGSWTLGNKQIAESAKKTNYLHLFEKQQSVNSFDWGYSQVKCHIDWIEPTRINWNYLEGQTTQQQRLGCDQMGSQGLKEKVR